MRAGRSQLIQAQALQYLSAAFTLALNRDGRDIGDTLAITEISGSGLLMGMTTHSFSDTGGSFTASDLKLDIGGSYGLMATVTQLDGTTVSVTHSITVSTWHK